MLIWHKKVEHYKDLLSHKKLGEEFFTFWDIETEKNRFYRNKTPIFFKDVDIDIVLVSNKISFGEKNFKYFVGYLYDNHKVNALHIMLPKASAYGKSYDGRNNKWMYFLN